MPALNTNKNNVKFEWKCQKYTSAVNLDKPPSIEYFNIKNIGELELSIRDYLGKLYKLITVPDGSLQEETEIPESFITNLSNKKKRINNDATLHLKNVSLPTKIPNQDATLL